MGVLAVEMPVVQAEKVQEEYVSGLIVESEAGITHLKCFRVKGPKDDREKVVFLELHMPTWAYDACVHSGGMSCIRNCGRRVPPLTI